MDAIDMIKQRRSVRKYKQETVDRKLLEEIVEISRFSPSWANYQVARYTFIDDVEKIERIRQEGVLSFSYNMNTLKQTKGLLVLSVVKGKSGRLGDDEYSTSKTNTWEIFDAGIACQTFCLAAHAKGIGTCIFGVIDDKAIAEIAELPEQETVTALITYGYPDETPAPTPRKDVSELVRYVDKFF